VVYNHTCESGVAGPTLSWRGLDAATYYRLDGHGNDVDVTGCGNTLDAREPRVIQMVLDSLRHWVQEMHVDGFRFDLATTIARGRDGYDPEHPFLVAAGIDPVLADVKLIAEPWDVGPHGWRTGQFPVPFSEWNDRFRDSVRDFWLVGTARTAAGEPAGGIRDLATRLAGSADVFATHRGPLASVNFVAAHDGFTLADLAAYNGKHNEANGEDNRDGSGNNHSWNHGVEGPTDDPEIAAFRRRTIRNLLATLVLATGVPMLLAGDEMGRTQHGNNNAYCLDDETSWLDWKLEPWQQDLRDTVAYLLALRREHPVLRQDRFFAGRPVHPDGTKDIAWFGPEGHEMDHGRWHDPALRTLQMYLHAVKADSSGRHVDGSLLVVVQGQAGPIEIRLPGEPWAQRYTLLWDSGYEQPPGLERGPEAGTVDAGATVTVRGGVIQIYGAPPPPRRPRG
jgi:isoamylase